MKNFKILFLAALTLCSVVFTGCFNILEEVTFRNNGSGAYKMVVDMSEAKGMMDMFKNMKPEGDQADSSGLDLGGMGGSGNPMGQLGDEMSNVANSIKNIQGVSNVVEINDTTNFSFGYSFDFADMTALNRALKVLNKEKYDSKVEEVYKFNGKSFERLGVGDLGAEMKKTMSEAGGDESEESPMGGMEMVTMFFKDMTYEQVYHFPDRVIKKSDNKLGEISADKHSISIKMKPFDEDQQKQKVSVATKLKLK